MITQFDAESDQNAEKDLSIRQRFKAFGAKVIHILQDFGHDVGRKIVKKAAPVLLAVVLALGPNANPAFADETSPDGGETISPAEKTLAGTDTDEAASTGETQIGDRELPDGAVGSAAPGQAPTYTEGDGEDQTTDKDGNPVGTGKPNGEEPTLGDAQDPNETGKTDDSPEDPEEPPGTPPEPEEGTDLPGWSGAEKDLARKLGIGLVGLVSMTAVVGVAGAYMVRRKREDGTEYDEIIALKPDSKEQAESVERR